MTNSSSHDGSSEIGRNNALRNSRFAASHLGKKEKNRKNPSRSCNGERDEAVGLLPKPLGGFIIVALIVLAVGLVGLSGVNKRLRAGRQPPEQGQEPASHRGRAGPSQQLRVQPDGHKDSGRYAVLPGPSDIDDSMELFDGLPMSAEEADLRFKFKPAFDAWWKDHGAFAALAQGYWRDLRIPPSRRSRTRSTRTRRPTGRPTTFCTTWCPSRTRKLPLRYAKAASK